MPSPVQGENYTVQPADTLTSLAIQAYGRGMLWSKIYHANTLRSGDPHLIFPGEILYIPPEEEVKQAQVKARENRYAEKPKGSVTLTVGGREVPTIQGRFSYALDMFASLWNAEIPWRKDKDPALDAILKRGSYADSELYLGGSLVGTGRLYARENTVTPAGAGKSLEFYSKTADLVDSSLTPKWSEIAGSNLKQIAETVLTPLGFGIDFQGDPGKAFEQIGRNGVETVAKYFQRLAAQRGFFVSCNEYAEVVFQRMAGEGAPVAGFVEGETRNALEYKAKFDDRSRFRTYLAYAQAGDGTAKITQEVTDKAVPGIRQLVFEAPECDPDLIFDAASWAMIKTLLEAYSFSLPVVDWYSDAGDLWKPNQVVTVKSSSLDIDEAKEFIIRQVEFAWGPSGRSATLSLVPPLWVEGNELKGVWE
jgi:prophage tail gpP-like protein